MPQGSDGLPDDRQRPALLPESAGRAIAAANARSAAGCLDYVLRHFRVCADRAHLECDLTTDVPGGEAVNLLAVATRRGLRATARVVSQETWKDLPVASLLQWGATGLIVYMGRVGDDALIYDPSGGHRRVACEEFMRLFTGVVVEFTRDGEAARA